MGRELDEVDRSGVQNSLAQYHRAQHPRKVSFGGYFRGDVLSMRIVLLHLSPE